MKVYAVPPCAAPCCLRFGTEVAVLRETSANPCWVLSPRDGAALLDNRSTRRPARDVSRKKQLMHLYPSRWLYYTVNIPCSAPLCSGDNKLFFTFSLSICEFAG